MFFIFISFNNKRIKIVWLIYTFILLGLSVRLYFLQVYPASYVLNNYTNKQSEVVSDVVFNVYDDNLKDLCDYTKKYVVVVDKKPFSLNNYEDTLKSLIAFNYIMKNGVDDFSFTDIINSSGKTYYDVSKETYDKVKKLINLKGVYAYERKEIDKKYAWNNGVMFQNMINLNDYSSKSLQQDIYNYLKDNENNYKDFYIDSDARYIETSEIVPSFNKNIQLTINDDLEQEVKEVLDKEEYKDYENIGIMIMESDTGKIKAMVQKDESMANINLGIEGVGYEPGSIFKAITLASALEEGQITMNSELFCNGRICKSGSHGKLSTEKAFFVSCNDIYAQIGNNVSYDKLIDYSSKCGLFDKVLNMQGETSGNKPKKEDGMNNISIGQCITVSPIQMLGAINTLINNGTYVKPYIVDKVLDSNNNSIKEYATEKINVFSKTTSMQVKEAMKGTILYGTGKKAYVDNVLLGGKTGSATSGNGKCTHCWFAGYYKLNDKVYTMIVCVPNINNSLNENVGGGGIAAPIFGDIIKAQIKN